MDPYFKYVRDGNLECLIQEYETNKNTVNYFQECFELACFHGNRDISHKLYEWGHPKHIDIHAKDDQIFYDAAIQGHIDILEDIYNWRTANHVYNLTNNILLTICKNNQLHIINKLLSWQLINNFNDYDNLIFRVLSGYNCGDILSKIYELSIENGNRIDLHYDTYYVFRNACYYGQLGNVKKIYYWALELNSPIDIHCLYEQPFRCACKSGNIELIKQLYNWSVETHTRINIRILNEDAFVSSCKLGKLGIIRQLRIWEPDIDLHHNNSECFVNSCKKGDIKILKQLYEWIIQDDTIYKLGNNVYTSVYEAAKYGHIIVLKQLMLWFDDIIINYFDVNQIILNNFSDNIQKFICNYIHCLKRDWIKTPQKYINQCNICLNNDTNVISTPCNHKFCKKCILKWILRSDLCPVCRQKI